MSESHLLPSWLRRRLAIRLARPEQPLSLPARRRACLYKVDRLGDFVLALGALRQLVAHFGEEECRLVVSAPAEPLAAAEFPRVARWVVPPAANGVWREVRPLRAQLAPAWAAERFDTLVCLRHAPTLYRDVTLGWIHAERFVANAPRPTAATLAPYNQPLLPATTPAPAPWCRELLAHRGVLAAVLDREPGWEELRPRLHSVTAAPGGDILFCPFGHDTVRDYPRDAWLAAWREARGPATSIRVIGPGARRTELNWLADGVRSARPDARVEVQTDLPGLSFVAAVAHARAIVTVDSAAAHLATALDKPAVIVAGGGHHGWFVPWGTGVRQRWLVHPLDCFGCNWHCRYPTVRCLAELPPALVAGALTEILGHG